MHSYERDANTILDAAVSPDDRLQKTVPLIAESIDASTVNIQQTIASGFVAVGAPLDTFSHQQQLVQVEQQCHHDAQIRTLQYQFKALATMVATGFSVLTGPPPSPTTTLSSLPSSSSSGPSSSSSASTALISLSPGIDLLNNGTHQQQRQPELGSGLLSGAEDEMPAYEQDRNISSVLQLWVEWKLGLGGRESVSEMDKNGATYYQ
ncbi:hypothetical protein CF328_g9604 [Tilletia controversa]|nr:hypothetical protein CF328_g9604 [Tilletia controversa]